MRDRDGGSQGSTAQVATNQGSATQGSAAQGSAAPVVALALALAIGSLTVTVSMLAHLGPVVHLPGINPWSLAAAFALCEIVPVHIEHRREAVSITLSTVPVVLGLFALSPLTLVAARLCGSAIALVLHRRQRIVKLTVNLTSFWVQTAVCVLVFRSFAGHATGLSSWPGLLVAILAGDLAQTIVLTSAISLYQRRWESSLLSSAALSSASAAVETCLGVVALSLLTSDPAALVPLGVVAVLVWLSYRTHRSLDERHRELRQLYDLTSVMGDALLDGRVVASLLQQARVLMHADQAWLYIRDENGALVKVADGPGSAATVEPDDGTGAALLDEARASNAPYLVADRHHLPLMGAREVLVAPLTGADGTSGVLVVADRSGEVRRFGSSDHRLLATIANHASVSLENDRLVDRLKDKAAESEHQSLHDALTGLPNRVLFARHLEEAIRDGSSAAVLLFDLDRFKEVNDTLGHHNGDLLLQQLGARLRSSLRRGDVIARLGGDEFAVLLPDINGEQAAHHVGRGIVELLEQPFHIGDMSVEVGASIGIAFAPRDGRDPVTLVQRADVAMYTAKADQTRVETYRSERDGYSPERLMLVSELRRAIHEQMLEVHYQPQVELLAGDTLGVEALVRWHHPTRGWIPPEEFVAIAEHTGLILPLTMFVLDRSLECCRRWQDAGRVLRMSVNLSARSLLEPNLAQQIEGLLSRHGLTADSLCLEVTESSIMGDPRRTAATLDSLRRLGVRISIDDFGTGQSSLAYLKKLPVGEIKVDKSFVLSMLSDRSDEAIVETIVTLARNLGIPVTAEGVENEATRERLVAMGCPAAQGYLFGRPMPEQELLQWLAGHGSHPEPGIVVTLTQGREPSMARTG